MQHTAGCPAAFWLAEVTGRGPPVQTPSYTYPGAVAYIHKEFFV